MEVSYLYSRRKLILFSYKPGKRCVLAENWKVDLELGRCALSLFYSWHSWVQYFAFYCSMWFMILDIPYISDWQCSNTVTSTHHFFRPCEYWISIFVVLCCCVWLALAWHILHATLESSMNAQSGKHAPSATLPTVSFVWNSGNDHFVFFHSKIWIWYW